jgi:hypothetical protein
VRLLLAELCDLCPQLPEFWVWRLRFVLRCGIDGLRNGLERRDSRRLQLWPDVVLFLLLLLLLVRSLWHSC